MKEELLAFIDKHRLIAPGERVLVALSGGADSTCLLHSLAQSGFEVAAAHLHHSQRLEGDADVEHCRALCASINVEFYAGRSDVPGFAKAHKMGVEEAGRKLRYEFLQMVASEGYEKIATGHTKDDNFESMLLHLARGSGMRGLCGIPVRRGQIIRPILSFTRAQTHEYCRQNKLAYISDSFNEDESYARNLVRSQVVANLKKVNSAAADHAFTTAAILTEENEILDSLAAAHLRANEIEPPHAVGFVERMVRGTWSGMRDLPIALLRRCVRQAAAMYGASIGYKQCQAIAEAIQSSSKVSFTAEGGEVSVSVSEGRWRVARTDRAEPFRELLTMDGETIADDLGWTLAVWRGKGVDSKLENSLDESKVRGDLYARSLKKGDRISPKGRGEQKLLSERLARAGVPQAVRARLPIVCDLIGPVWAPIVGVDRRCLPGVETTDFIGLRLSANEEPPGTVRAV